MLLLGAKFAAFRRRHARAAVATVGVFGITLASLAAASGPAGASVGSDQADITRLEQQIAQEGEHAQSLVSHFNEVQAQVNALDAQIAHDQKVVADDQAVEAAAMTAMRRMAVKAYVSGGPMDSPPLALFSGTSNITNALEQNQYLGAVSDKFDAVLTTLKQDQAHTRDDQRGLQGTQDAAKHTLALLASARDAATSAISADEAKLTRVNGDLRTLLAAANARHAAEERAAERALAAAKLAPVSRPAEPAVGPVNGSPPPSSPTTTPPPTNTPSPPPSSSAGYSNPLRDIVALTPERIDQGVDYAGFGSIYALGNGVVLNTVGSGWPGGTFIAYQLTSGPASGLVVFAAEDIQPSVQVGDRVTSSTVIGHMYAGPDGIEMGWANGSRLPDTMARTYGQFDGSNSSAFGANFSDLLQSVGAPGGVPSGSPRGVLPASWPRW